jgi:hypothetical protein
MRGKNKIKVEELNLRLKQLTGSPDEVDLRKMTLTEVEDLIESSRPRMVEIARKANAEKAIHTKKHGYSYHRGKILSNFTKKVLSLFHI